MDSIGATMKHNYEVRIVGEEVAILAKVMTEAQGRMILEHFVKTSRLKNISFRIKRVTPEPFSANSKLGNILWTDTSNNDITSVDTLNFRTT